MGLLEVWARRGRGARGGAPVEVPERAGAGVGRLGGGHVAGHALEALRPRAVEGWHSAGPANSRAAVAAGVPAVDDPAAAAGDVGGFRVGADAGAGIYLGTYAQQRHEAY